MNMHFSDVIYLLLNVIIVYFIISAFQNTYNQKIWIKIFRQPIAAISLGVLLVFWLISILDSIRFNHFTLVDFMFYPLNEVMEFSYSKPFAVNLLIPKVKFIDGKYQALYAHLSYVPKTFKSSIDVWAYVFKLLFKVSLFFSLTLAMVWIFFRKKIYHLLPYQKNILWMIISFLLTVAVFIFLLFLSRQFHVFGTGQIGQDILYQAVKSIRTGMLISLMTTMLMLPFALGFGLVAGYYGGAVDMAIQFIYTTISSIPSVLFIGSVLLAWQLYISAHHSSWNAITIADTRLMMICVLLGLTDWAHLCRYIRAEVLKLRELDYIQAAKLLGTSKSRILLKHLLPNTMHLIITSLVLNFSFLVLAESVLTYLGIGVSPLTISWGNMINAARLELARDPVIWWPLMAAFIFMFILVLSCNLFADSLRKALNPREEIHD